MDNYYSIYVLKHPVTLKIVYVGSSCRPNYRKATHKWLFFKKYQYVPIFQVLEIIADCKTAKAREVELIIKYRKEGQPLLNISDTGKGKLPLTNGCNHHKNLKAKLLDQFDECIKSDDFE